MNELYCAESRVDALKQRTRRCCCKYCGGKLELKRIMFNDYEDARIEIFCDQCDRIEYGVEPEIYQSAQRFVDNLEFNYYNDMDENEKTHQMNVAKVCEIMAWGYRDLGLVNPYGFTVQLDDGQHNWDESIVIKDQDLPTEEVATDDGHCD